MVKKLSFASIMTALTVICLYGSVTLPTGRIALLAITSLCVLVTVIQSGTKYAWLQYIAASVIGFLLVPFKAQILLFVLFIGYYPIAKKYIEQIKNLWIEWIVKILFFLTILILAYFLLTMVLLPFINFGPILDVVLSHLALVFFVALAIFIVYDYFLSLLASYYAENIKKRLIIK